MSRADPGKHIPSWARSLACSCRISSSDMDCSFSRFSLWIAWASCSLVWLPRPSPVMRQGRWEVKKSPSLSIRSSRESRQWSVSTASWTNLNSVINSLAQVLLLFLFFLGSKARIGVKKFSLASNKHKTFVLSSHVTTNMLKSFPACFFGSLRRDGRGKELCFFQCKPTARKGKLEHNSQLMRQSILPS